ncbi:MAG: FAD-dependent oxidoreductase [Clostridium sp.]|jgi:NAD(P)H-nitrite reductase large subunit|nr:FAD-dependent oxidoreductase [Clostridium sp.]
MRIVIVGNSTAAIGAVEGIRSADKKAEITIIASEREHSYSRPLISYLLEGKTDLERMKYRPNSFYADNNVSTMLGRSVTAVNAAEHFVELADGERLQYDRLLWAAGSRPFIPPIEGLEQAGYFTFQSLEDAQRLSDALTPQSRVLIVGAGLIGLKCAEGIYSRVGGITVAEFAPRILPSILDEDGAAIVQKHLEAKGLKFYLSNAVKSVDGKAASLADGTVLEYDTLVIASGVKPNVEQLSAAGAKTARGILTDDCGRTSLPDIYAAGDCTESTDLTDGESRILAILPNAYIQGRTAGKAMVGVSEPFSEAMPVNSIGVFGLHIGTVGMAKGESIVVNNGDYRRFFLADNRLTGFILVGDIKRAGIYTALVRSKVPLDKMNLELLAQKPQLALFGAAERDRMLNGEVVKK